MNPITIIRERIAESRRREEFVFEAPWIRQEHADGLSHRILKKNGPEILSWEACSELTKDDAAFIASARSDLPMWRSIAERAVEALEKISDRRVWEEPNETVEDALAKEATGALAAIAQQLAEGGIEG